jgi:hypothetical protein
MVEVTNVFLSQVETANGEYAFSDLFLFNHRDSKKNIAH